MYARVGKISAAVGTKNPLRSDVTGALVTASTGKYKDATAAGRVFIAANQAAVAFSSQFTLVYTGLVLWNPPASGKNCTVLESGFALSAAASAATVVGLMTGLDAGDAAASIVPRNRLKGGPASSMIVDAGCTLVGTPVLEMVFSSVSTAATTLPAAVPSRHDQEGSLILTPGYYAAFWSFAAITVAAWCYFMWEEEDL